MQTRLPTEEHQAEIVAAELKLAWEHSPLAITTSDLAAAIAVSQGAVFEHFPTKDAIWLAAMKCVRERCARASPEALKPRKVRGFAAAKFKSEPNEIDLQPATVLDLWLVAGDLTGQQCFLSVTLRIRPVGATH